MVNVVKLKQNGTEVVPEQAYCASNDANGQPIHTTYVKKNLEIPAVCLELQPHNSTDGHGGYIDFHYNRSTADNTSRIIEDASGQISINGIAKFTSSGVNLNDRLAIDSWQEHKIRIIVPYNNGDVTTSGGLLFEHNNGVSVAIAGTVTGSSNNGYRIVVRDRADTNWAFFQFWDNGWLDMPGRITSNGYYSGWDGSNRTLIEPTTMYQNSTNTGVTCQQYMQFNGNHAATDELQSSGTHRFIGKCPPGTSGWFGIRMNDSDRRIYVDTSPASTSTLKNITISSGNPSGGQDGDVWIQI